MRYTVTFDYDAESISKSQFEYYLGYWLPRDVDGSKLRNLKVVSTASPDADKPAEDIK